MSQLVRRPVRRDAGRPGSSPLVDAARRSFVIDENWDFVDFTLKLKDISGGNVRFGPSPSPASTRHRVGRVHRREPEQVASSSPGSPAADDDVTGRPRRAAPGAGPRLGAVTVVNTTAIDGLAARVCRCRTGLTAGSPIRPPPHLARGRASGGRRRVRRLRPSVAARPGRSRRAPGRGRVCWPRTGDPTGESAGIESASPRPPRTRRCPAIAQRPTFDAGADVPCVN